MAIIPDKFFLTKGKGIHEKEMRAFEEALKNFDSYKAPSPIDPVWGRPTTQYFLSQIQ